MRKVIEVQGATKWVEGQGRRSYDCVAVWKRSLAGLDDWGFGPQAVSVHGLWELGVIPGFRV